MYQYSGSPHVHTLSEILKENIQFISIGIVDGFCSLYFKIFSIGFSLGVVMVLSPNPSTSLSSKDGAFSGVRQRDLYHENR